MLKAHAYQLIKQRLFDLDLVSGQFVSQKQIVELIDFPLGPVREAMLQLQAEGLVEIFPQRGIQITPVTVEMVRDLFGLRRLIEPPGIKALARTGDLAALKELRRATKEALQKEKSGEVKPVSNHTFQVDQRLHEMAIDALDNKLVREIYRVQQDRILLIRLNIRPWATQEPGLVDHLHILDALCRRDAAGATASLLRHLKNAEQAALDALARSPHIKTTLPRAASNGTRPAAVQT
ncbi:MAG: GntR family transcriptional regulator [Pseudolabrys sp.]|nr:GntR family transcriptional regulator [Pseudolabrys sp.]